MALKRVSIGSLQDVFLYDDEDEYTDEDGNPIGVTLKSMMTDGTIGCADPVEPNEAVTLGSLEGLLAGYDEFIDMTDTPVNYTAANYKLVRVNNTPDALEFATLAGTANQVVVTHGMASVTLSLPQDIDTGASFEVNDLTLTTPLAANYGGTGQDTSIWSGWARLAGGTWYSDNIDAEDIAAGEFSAGNFTFQNNIMVDGGDIGITTHPNLIQMAANAVTINGVTTTLGLIVRGGTASQEILMGDAAGTKGYVGYDYESLVCESNLRMYAEGQNFIWYTVSGGSATQRMQLSTTNLTLANNLLVGGGNIGLIGSTDLIGLSADTVYIRGAFYISQTNATFGHQAMTIDQDDQDKAFIDYRGTSEVGYSKNLSTAMSGGASASHNVVGPRAGTPGWAHAGMMKVEINGVERWMAYYEYTV